MHSVAGPDRLALDKFRQALLRVGEFAEGLGKGVGVHMSRLGHSAQSGDWYGIEKTIQKILTPKAPVSVYHYVRRGSKHKAGGAASGANKYQAQGAAAADPAIVPGGGGGGGGGGAAAASPGPQPASTPKPTAVASAGTAVHHAKAKAAAVCDVVQSTCLRGVAIHLADTIPASTAATLERIATAWGGAIHAHLAPSTTHWLFEHRDDFAHAPAAVAPGATKTTVQEFLAMLRH